MFSEWPTQASRTLLPSSTSPAITRLVFAYDPLSQDSGERALCSCLLTQLQLQLRPRILGEMSGESQGPCPPPRAQFQRSARERTQQGQSLHRHFSSHPAHLQGNGLQQGTTIPHSLPGELSTQGSWMSARSSPNDLCFSILKESLFQPLFFQLLLCICSAWSLGWRSCR